MSSAIIDIGSGSVRLLLGEKKTTVMTKLSEGLDESGVLSPVAMQRTVCSFVIGGRLSLPESAVDLRLVLPVSFSVVLTGLFIVMARKKAITQAVGFLTFENGIALFGNGMMIECGLAVELGILLDVFVLVFVMGIAVMRINRAFEHIDADKLTLLGENSGGDVK